MDRLVIEGSGRLEGSIRIHGAKNAVLPILAATVLNGGENVIHNCPELSDVDASAEILRYLGCEVRRDADTLTVNSESMMRCDIPEELMREMRSSVIFLGAIIARFARADAALPGGCELGPRPIDLHLKAFRQLGIDVYEEHGYIKCSTGKIVPASIHLDFPSVGATENIMLASVLAEGTTVITNAAREPEIEDLQDFLNTMGARVHGAGTSVIRIDGVKRLGRAEHRVIPDRIAAATYMACGAAAGGTVELTDTQPRHMKAFLSAAEQYGAKLYISEGRIVQVVPERLTAIKTVRTQPHPGFPTDAQAPLMAAMSVADGTSVFIENIFESRYKHVYELCRMGADITVDGRDAIVRGVKRLSGANVTAMDLRGGAALAVAAAAAEGITEISGMEHVDRGYEKLDENLRRIGLRAQRVSGRSM